MKRMATKLILLGFTSAFSFSGLVQAKTDSLGSTLDMSVFPAKGQETSQQSQDEAACYEWAADNTGVDPFDLEKQAQADEQQAQAEMQAAAQAGQGARAQAAEASFAALQQVR